MVQVYIPAGEFTMGEDEFIYRAGARPAHLVSLDAYWIDQTEVTHGMYDLCVQAGACQWRSSYTYTLADALIPVGYVNWNESLAYCTWAGRRLPTEAEWEKAARGTDGRIYPWGNTAPNCYLANSYSCAGQVMPAGSYPDGKSPYGVLEMAGNLWEWVADWYQEDYYSVSPAYNPAGPASGIYRVVRGGGWFGVKEGLRTTYRLYNTPGYGTVEYGFRCAATVAP
jgi:formylglycine-generating enzyme required for sulfatase activity